VSRFAEVVALALAGLLAAGAGCGDTGSPPTGDPPGTGDPPDSIPKQETCEKHASLLFGEYAVTNNMHGENRLVEGDTYEQCVAIDSGGFPVTWYWNVETEQPFVKGFPQIAFGRNPWTQLSTTDALPAKVADIESLRVAHEVDLDAEGAYNLAFDIWLAADDTPTHTELVCEVMVWLDGTLPAAGQDLGEMIVDGVVYRWFLLTAEGFAPLYEFVARTPRPSGTTDLLAFLRHLETGGRLSGESYVAAVELGTEMWDGSGSIRVNAYSIGLDKR
jgi:hypothetical protein